MLNNLSKTFLTVEVTFKDHYGWVLAEQHKHLAIGRTTQTFSFCRSDLTLLLCLQRLNLDSNESCQNMLYKKI